MCECEWDCFPKQKNHRSTSADMEKLTKLHWHNFEPKTLVHKICATNAQNRAKTSKNYNNSTQETKTLFNPVEKPKIGKAVKKKLHWTSDEGTRHSSCSQALPSWPNKTSYHRSVIGHLTPPTACLCFTSNEQYQDDEELFVRMNRII